jgi:hypothetical protein
VEADVKVAFRLGNPKKETNRPLKLVQYLLVMIAIDNLQGKTPYYFAHFPQ